MTAPVLGFIGLGRMGGLMAARLLAAGHRLVVCDTVPAAMAPLIASGAMAAADPADVADQADIVITCLPTPKVVEEVALGKRGVAQGKRAKFMVDTSTTGSAVAARVAEGLAKHGIAGIDSPVSGGLAGARAGTLAVMLACTAAQRPVLEPVLSAFGRIFHVGEKPGLGQSMKLVNNILSAVSLAATAEAVVMGVKAGLAADTIIDVVNAGTGRSSASQDKFPRAILPRSFDFGMPAGLFLKDVGLYLSEAEALDAPREIAEVIVKHWRETAETQGADKDMTTIVRMLEERAGVRVAAKDAPHD
ncbi:MAG: hypothetical protein RIS83_548 [Pseudomonadota bacterium]